MPGRSRWLLTITCLSLLLTSSNLSPKEPTASRLSGWQLLCLELGPLNQQIRLEKKILSSDGLPMAADHTLQPVSKRAHCSLKSSITSKRIRRAATLTYTPSLNLHRNALKKEVSCDESRPCRHSIGQHCREGFHCTFEQTKVELSSLGTPARLIRSDAGKSAP